LFFNPANVSGLHKESLIESEIPVAQGCAIKINDDKVLILKEKRQAH